MQIIDVLDVKQEVVLERSISGIAQPPLTFHSLREALQYYQGTDTVYITEAKVVSAEDSNLVRRII